MIIGELVLSGWEVGGEAECVEVGGDLGDALFSGEDGFSGSEGFDGAIDERNSGWFIRDMWLIDEGRKALLGSILRIIGGVMVRVGGVILLPGVAFGYKVFNPRALWITSSIRSAPS